MLVLHVYIIGRNGNVERSYDFMRNDGKDELDGCDIVIPYAEENPRPVMEQDALALLFNEEMMKGEH